MLERLFELRAHGTTVGTEVLAGGTTFVVMAYIIFVNPAILSLAGSPALAGQGPGFAPTLAATCLVAGVMTILTLMLSDFFDTMGTVIGIGAEADWLDAQGQLPRLNRVLLIDSLGALCGGIASASSATTYVESAAGVTTGGRTGLTSLITAGGFFLALFLSPLVAIVPPQATAGALIVVGYLMCRLIRAIPFGDFEEGFPALATMLAMPLTYSITNGIGTGLLLYVLIKMVRGRFQELPMPLLIVALAFLLYFAEPRLRQLL